MSLLCGRLTTFGPATAYNKGEHDLVVPEGYREDNRGAAVTSDGTAWWVSPLTGLSSYNHAIAQFAFSMTRHYASVPGLPATGLVDIAAIRTVPCGLSIAAAACFDSIPPHRPYKSGLAFRASVV